MSLVAEKLPARQISRGGGHYPFSVAVWTPEVNGNCGLDEARANQEAWGGHVFKSTTRPGYVVWFDSNYTPSEIMTHDVVKGHSGIINPSKDEEEECPQNIERW